jgi:hypothetical protein
MDLFQPKYVFDTGPFIDLKNYPRDIFTSLWDNFERMINEGSIVSSTEVFRELEKQDDEITSWAKGNKKIFLKPTLEEQNFVRQILAKHPHLVKAGAILSGSPEADPFVIAQAKAYDCTLVHREKFKPNSHKIPAVCADFGVEEIYTIQDFFRKEKWSF